MTVHTHLEEILDTGYAILIELKKEELNLSRIRELYNRRAEIIEKMTDYQPKPMDDVTREERETSQKLFTRLQLLEKNLNKNLAMLSSSRVKALKEVGVHRKARVSYGKASRPPSGSQSKIIDLKPEH